VSLIAAPPGMDAVPSYDRGWLTGSNPGQSAPYLSYADASADTWSGELASLHAKHTRSHFIDVWTRHAILERVVDVASDAVLVDVGCSSGYLLEALQTAHPQAVLIGVDLDAAGLRIAHELVPSARLLQADACDLPLDDGCVDAVVSANLVEHLPDDRRALAEMRRVLRPDGLAVVVVPAGAGTYDYYDRFLGHERRYARRELSGKAADAGFDLIDDSYIASLPYPAFWLRKKWNRRRYRDLSGPALARRVASDVEGTGDLRIGGMLRRVEARLGLRLPFGIRNIVSLRRRP
jgi:SAM-dependent methyltransferase